MFKKIIFSVVPFAIATSLEAGSLLTFMDIQHAVTKGHNVHIVVNNSHCKSGSLNGKPSFIGVYEPKSFYIREDNSIATSQRVFTRASKKFPNHSIYKTMDYLIKADETVNITVDTLG